MCFKVAWEWIVVELLPGAVAAGTVVARIPWGTLPKLLAVVVMFSGAMFLWPHLYTDSR
jgi:hypothetical protein